MFGDTEQHAFTFAYPTKMAQAAQAELAIE
jgi:hypothetical protein